MVRGEDPRRGRRNRRRWHGLSEKVGQTYKYYLTELGRRAVLVGLKRKEHLLVPGWAAASAGAAKYLAPPAPDFPGKGLNTHFRSCFEDVLGPEAAATVLERVEFQPA